MNKADLTTLTESTCKVVQEVGKFIRNEFGQVRKEQIDLK